MIGRVCLKGDEVGAASDLADRLRIPVTVPITVGMNSRVVTAS